MHHDNPQRHIALQKVCLVIVLISIPISHINLPIGTVLGCGAVTVFALDWLYLASDDNGRY